MIVSVAVSVKVGRGDAVQVAVNVGVDEAVNVGTIVSVGVKVAVTSVGGNVLVSV